MSRYRVGKRPELNRRLGSRDRVDLESSVERTVRDGGTPWDVRWQGPPFPSDRVSFDPHARVKDMDLEGVDVSMICPRVGFPRSAASTTSRWSWPRSRPTIGSSATTAGPIPTG